MNSFRIIPLRTALLAACLLTGPGLAVTSFADEAMPAARSDGIGAVISDTAITAKVKVKLMRADNLDDSDIRVTTTNGVVALEGTASSTDASDEAADKARQVKGVKSVYNRLATPSGSKLEAKAKHAAAETKRVVSDSWITTKVKSELMADSISKGFDVHVDTRGGVVVLKGDLANQDAIDRVQDIAGKVEGVRSVDTSALGIKGK